MNNVTTYSKRELYLVVNMFDALHADASVVLLGCELVDILLSKANGIVDDILITKSTIRNTKDVKIIMHGEDVTCV